eukprot:1306582-Pleurochrysis_carterae.AAC.1
MSAGCLPVLRLEISNEFNVHFHSLTISHPPPTHLTISLLSSITLFLTNLAIAGDDVASDATDDAPPARTKRGKSTHKHADADVAPAASLHADERRAEEMLAKLLHS